MATTTIKVRAAVGETEVTLTRIAGTLCSISVSQALTGNWHCIDSVGTETLIQDLVDEAITVELGEVPSTADVLAEFGDGSDLTALLTATGFAEKTDLPTNFGSLSIDGSGRVTLNPTQMTELLSDDDIGDIATAIINSFNESSDVPIATQAAATVDRLKADATFIALVANALAAKTAAQSVDGKLTTLRAAKLDR